MTQNMKSTMPSDEKMIHNSRKIWELLTLCDNHLPRST
uniref:Uncharacterized protein n=1 Tax=Anguilla anguilla TaxID=7936 RepID=A0A0E9P8R5_ANGAN